MKTTGKPQTHVFAGVPRLVGGYLAPPELILTDAPTSSHKGRFANPAQMPERLADRILRLSQPKTWVLDPFCGTGTFLVAAARLGIPSIGIDTSPTQTAIARQRLEREFGDNDNH